MNTKFNMFESNGLYIPMAAKSASPLILVIREQLYVSSQLSSTVATSKYTEYGIS